MKKEATIEQENREDYSARLDNRQPTETSENSGFVLISVFAPDYIRDEYDYEYKEFIEWYKAGEELDSILDSLRNYDAVDCRISLAEYSEPKQDIEHIEQIRTLIVYIPQNEKFYYSTVEEARDALLEIFREHRIPHPNEIQYVIGGYYVKWNLAKGFSGSEILLWKWVQRTLKDKIASELGTDLTDCDDATEMLYASGFKNSSYVGFDLSEKVITIYRNEEEYSSPLEFVKRLPLRIGEIESYRSTKKFSSRVKINFAKNSTQKEENFVNNSNTDTEKYIRERAKIWLDSLVRVLRDDKCKGEEYRLYQVKAIGNPKRRKNYKWLRVNAGNEVLPKFYGDRDSWISAATYYTKWKGKGYVASINCNLQIIKWAKSELDYVPTPEEGRELVLSICREHGLPEPCITSTPDGLEVKFYWQDRMQKVFYDDDPYCSKFNEDWERIQRELYKIFWYLGVDMRKGATAMFSMPGSVNTTKKLKTDDRQIRDIHKGVIVSSYRTIQRILGLKETGSLEVPDELLGLKWEVFSTHHRELAADWLVDVLRMHPSSKNWVCISMIKGVSNSDVVIVGAFRSSP